MSSKRLFIGSGVLFGLAFASETIGAALAISCTHGEPCADGPMYSWGSPEAGTRFTLMTSGPGTAYVGGRLAAIPLVWTGAGLLLAGAHVQASADVGSSRATRVDPRLAWGLFGTGVGIWLGSRLARLGFAYSGICQEPTCVYAFDQATLGSSRALALAGSGLLWHHYRFERLRLDIGPSIGWGLALTGQF